MYPMFVIECSRNDYQYSELILYLSHVMKVENIIQATVSVCGRRSFMNGFDCILIGIRKGYFYCFHLHVVG